MIIRLFIRDNSCFFYVMRYAIFSDVHSNLEALEAVIKAYESEAVDKYFCVGDSVGYGANPNECIAKIRALETISVAGNHDWASVNKFSLDNLVPLARQAVCWTMNHLSQGNRDFLEHLTLVYKNGHLTLAHGSLNCPQEFNYTHTGEDAWAAFNILETKLCFIGHSHIPGIFIRDITDNIRYSEESSIEIKEYNNYIINVGSVGQPRDGNPKACFCIYDTDTAVVEIKRVAYNAEETQNKIISAGLPRRLGDRLLIGK